MRKLKTYCMRYGSRPLPRYVLLDHNRPAQPMTSPTPPSTIVGSIHHNLKYIASPIWITSIMGNKPCDRDLKNTQNLAYT